MTLLKFLLILVIPVILVILVALACIRVPIGPQWTTRQRKRRAASALIGLLKTPLRAYAIDIGGFPSTQQGLESLGEAPSDLADINKWKGKYLQDPMPPDPWGNEYQYRFPGTHKEDAPDIWSFGPDGLNGTEDDVTNWDENT